MQNTTGDPATQVQPELRPHIHLVSSFKCESRGDPFNFSKEQIADLLKAAALETKSNNASWCWKMLEAPRDRTSLIVWQSPQQLQGRQFPSDGYVWADNSESVSVEQLQGFKLETYRHYSGYVPSYEQYTLHARTRYRLLPIGTSHAAPGCDPCIWLVLYQRAVKSKILHVRGISLSNIQSQKPVIEQRRTILHNGVPKSKEFVWEDRSHWPDIRLPQAQGPPRTYGPNLIARSQQQPYIAGQQLIDPRTGQPTAKRLKQAQAAPSHTFPEGEDDGGSGDIMDILSPRDISRARYRQHSEWMEELYASPYSINQIRPTSIGLGRKGELAALSRGLGFIDTPTGLKDHAALRRITSEDYSRYIRNAEERMAELRAEIEKEKEVQGRRMAKLKQGTLFQDAERRLRGAVQLPSHSNSSSGVPRSERDPADQNSTQKDVDAAALRQSDEVDLIVREIESSLNRHVQATGVFSMISKGGLEDRASTPIDQHISESENTQDNKSNTMQTASASDDFVAVNTPNETSHTFTGSAGNGTGNHQTDEDYVMVDKDHQIEEPFHGDNPADVAESTPEDNMGGDDFLDYEADGNDDNFDSMFTDTIGAGADLEVPDDAMEGLDTTLVQTDTGGDNNAIDSLSGGQDQ